jgi:hypothetical protein
LYAGSPSVANAGTADGYVNLKSLVTTTGGKFTGVSNNTSTGFYITQNSGTGINTSTATGAGGDITIKDNSTTGWIGLNGAVNAGNRSTAGDLGGTVRLQAATISQSIPGAITARNLGAVTTGIAPETGYISLGATNNVSGNVSLDASRNIAFTNQTGFKIGEIVAEGAGGSLFVGANGVSSNSSTGQIRLAHTTR